MSTTYLAVGLSYVVIGFALAAFFVFILRRRFTGDFWAAALVASAAAFLGGIVDFLFADIIEQLRAINGILNIFPPLIAAALALSIYAALSEKKDPYE
jgi:hypothetical protein